MAKIHPTAIVDPGAQLGDGVEVGAFSIIEEQVVIGDRVRIGPHVVVRNHSEVGADTRIFQFCSIGDEPQHRGYNGEPTRLVIGRHNTIREYCTLHRGTAARLGGQGVTRLGGQGVTRLGDHNLIMAYAHIAHDCTLGDRILFANGASLAGHVEVGDHAVLGGFALVHQHCNIGAHCMIGMGTVCRGDVPPYIVAAGNPAKPSSLNSNSKGLRQRGFEKSTIKMLKKAYNLLYRSDLRLEEAIDAIGNLDKDSVEIKVLCDFLRRSRSMDGNRIIR